MDIFTSPRLERLKEYVPEDTGYSLRMDANESFVSLPPALRAAVAEAIAALEFNRYPDPIATEVITLFGAYIGLSPNCITAGNGSDELINVLIASILDKGQRLLVCSPDFAMYRFYAEVADVPIVPFGKAEPDFSIDPAALVKAANEAGCGMIILSNPCSPTGQVLTKEQVEGILKQAECTVVIDEAYGDFFDQSVIDLIQTYSNLVVLKTASKALGLAALRLGFALTNEKNTAVLRKTKSIYNVNSLTQAAAAVVLRDTAFLQAAKADIIGSRDMLYAGLCTIDGLSVLKSAGNFIFVRPDMNAGALHAALKESGICVRLMGDYLRITCAQSAQNQIFIDRMGELCGRKV